MGNGDGFYKKATDKAYIQQNMKDGQPVGEYILIRRVSGRTDGNPTQGEQPTLVYKTKKTTGVVEFATPEEVSSNAGIYQYGDLHLELLEELKFIDERTGDMGDRVIYKNQTYRVFGRTQPRNVINKDVYFAYLIRKVGNK